MKKPFSPRKSPTQARAQDTVDSILTAAAHILTLDTGRDITTNEIAQKAGVSIGSLYQYFPKKESILAALTEKYVTRRLALIEEKFMEFADLGISTDEAIDRMINVMIELKIKNLKLERALLNYFSRSGDLEMIQRLDLRFTEVINRVLAARTGDLRKLDPEWTGFILTQAVRAALFSTLTHRPQKIRDEGLKNELRILIRGFLLPARGP